MNLKTIVNKICTCIKSSLNKDQIDVRIIPSHAYAEVEAWRRCNACSADQWEGNHYVLKQGKTLSSVQGAVRQRGPHSNL